MRAFVFTDSALAGLAGQFVWLELDVEQRQSAAFLRRFPVEALPTYFLVDPRDETVLLKWVGAATASQLDGLLERARLARSATPGSTAADADERLAAADRLYGAGKSKEAADAYEFALAGAPAGWPQFGRAVESLVLLYSLDGEHELGARLAAETMPRLAGTASALNVSATGLDCALQLTAEHAERMSWIVELSRATWAAVGDSLHPIAADDRSSAYGILVSAERERGDSLAARRTAETWARFLEAEAGRARTTQERAVYDSHRLSAYLELGEPQRALPMLIQSEQDFPDDYNPPARLAIAYRELGRLEEALAASRRALALAYGPRRLRVFETQASIQLRAGDEEGARATLDEAVRYAQDLPEGQRSEARIEALQERLREIP